jgi:hypothetical protein
VLGVRKVHEKINIFFGGMSAEPFPIAVEGGRCACRDWKAVSRAHDTEARNKDRAFLAACGIRFDDDIFPERNQMDEELRSYVAAALTEAEAKLKRRGTLGPWCFYCGEIGEIGMCGCAFGETFRCCASGVLICAPCAQAHRAVAEHLREMFSAKITQRSNSVRAKMERTLYRAARAVCNPSDSDEYDPCSTRDLVFFLGQPDPFCDSHEEFEAKTLRAFRRSRFLDFLKLAAEIAREQDAEIFRAAARALVTRRQTRA